MGGSKNQFVLAGWLLTTLLGPSLAAAATVREAWVQRFNGAQTSLDEAYQVACDPQGNVVVAGYTDDSIYGGDILVIKYSSAGVPLWTNRYNGPTSDEDRPNALAVDSGGNVFVAGSSVRNGYWNWITLAYSATGTPLWTNTYGGLGDKSAKAIAVSEEGTVYVAGTGVGYEVVSYSNSGVPLWTNSYRSENWASPTGIAVASDGHVVVTGVYATYNGYQDFATVAFSSAGGVLWTNGYRGPGGYAHIPSALGVDTKGNVFVTGQSDNESTYAYSAYATVGYSAAGVPLWTNRFDRSAEGLAGPTGPTGLALDASGNVLVTGWAPMPKPPGPGASVRTTCYATVAYANSGVPLWTNLYTGAGEDASAAAVVVDGRGDVLVTGSSVTTVDGPAGYATIKYSGAGEPLWTNSCPGPTTARYLATDLAVNAQGEAFVTGFSFDAVASAQDWIILGVSSEGVSLWTNRYNGPANALDYPTAVATDGNGGIFVTGYSVEGSTWGYATLKYSAAGEKLWMQRYSDPIKNNAVSRAMAVDGTGNVFVTGQCQRSNSCYATIAYSGEGLPLWTNLYDGGYGSRATALAVDPIGTVFVTGSSGVRSGDFVSDDFVTVAYSNSGAPLWTNWFGMQYSDSVTALALDSNGNVIVTGNSMAQNGSADFATVSYSSAGVPLWTNFYNGPGNGDDYPKALASDRAGNVIVIGTSLPGSAVVKYSGSGSPLWVSRFDGTASAVAVDGGGRIIVTGQLYQNSSYDYATVAYSSDGLPLWTNIFGGPGMSDDRAVAVVVDEGGNAFVSGYSGSTNIDIVTVTYSAAGVALSTNSYNGPANGLDRTSNSKCLALTSDGSLVVAGTSDGDYSEKGVSDYVVVKYDMPAAIVSSTKTDTAFQLSFSAMPGRRYITQFTTNLTSGSWRDLGTNTADPNGVWSPIDSSAIDPERFYRGKWLGP